MYIINNLTILLLKYLSAALLIVAAAGTVAAQSNSEEIQLTEEEQAWIAEHPTITASNNTAYPPFDFISAGEPVGLSIDYLNLLTSKVGLKVKYINYGSLSENLKMGMEQKIDVVHTIVENEERHKNFTFSNSFISDAVVFYGRVGSERINNINDLKDKKIGFIRGHAIFTSYQQHFPDLNYVLYTSNMEALRALSANEIDVYPYETTPIEFHIFQNKLQAIEIVGDDFIMKNHAIDYRIAVHKNNPILMGIINKSMVSVSSEEFEEISDKWIKSDQTPGELKLTPAEQSWLAENKVIKVSAVQDAFPYEFIDDDGGISGVSGDFLNEISKRLNVKFVWVGNDDWNDGLLKIQSNDADMVSLITPTKERQRYLDFSDEYLSLQHVIVSRDDSTVFLNIDTLLGKTIVQIKGQAIIGYLNENYPTIKVVEKETRKEALELLSSGGADAMLSDVARVLANISDYGFENLRIVGTTPYSEVLAIGVSSDLPLLSSAVQKALTNINYNTSSPIFTKWLTQPIDIKIDYGPLYYVIGIALFVGLIILFWNRKLRNEIELRKKVELDLIKAKEASETANKAKSAFLANMSHEIRTPLNAMIGFTGILKSEVYGKIEGEKNKEYLEIVETSSHHLLGLINDILDLSRIAEGHLEIYPQFMEVEREITKCVSTVQQLASDKTLTIDTQLQDIEIESDIKLFTQILINILSNAIKFTPNHGIITIKNYTVCDDLIVEIIDTGIGMDADEIEVALSQFGQVQSAYTRDYVGTGLGLPLVNKLMVALGGRLEIKSKKNAGTRIFLFFPNAKNT